MTAQDRDGAYDSALAELRAGSKQTHWMWFVLPQLAGLGRSATAQRYALADLGEARDYMAHPVLGPRLRERADVLAALPGADARQVLGEIDAQKLRSCLTLFSLAAPGEPVFEVVLAKYFAGRKDTATLALLT